MSYSFVNGNSGSALVVAVGALSDLDGDGIAETVVQSTEADDLSAASVHVILSTGLEALDAADGADGVIDIAGMSAAYGYTITFAGLDSADGGITTANAGDVDGSGDDDLLIVPVDPVPGFTGALVFGEALAMLDGDDGTQDGVIALAQVPQSGGYLFAGPGSIAAAGDTDMDGRAELLLGGGGDPGTTLVFDHEDLGALDAADGAADGRIDLGEVPLDDERETYRFIGIADRLGASGFSIDAGALEDDGFFLIGDDFGLNEFGNAGLGGLGGATYLAFKSELAALDAADGAENGIIDVGLIGDEHGYVFGHAAETAFTGWSVAAPGDVTGGAAGDILIGAFRGGRPDHRTEAYLVADITPETLAALDTGTGDGAADRVIDLADLGDVAGNYTFVGGIADNLGQRIVAPGDMDGNGKDDFVIAAPDARPASFQTNGDGQYTLIFGERLSDLDGASPDGEAELGDVDGTTGYEFVSSAGSLEHGGVAAIHGAVGPRLLFGSSGADAAYLVGYADLAALDAAGSALDLNDIGDAERPGRIDLANVGATHGGYVFLGEAAATGSIVQVASAGIISDMAADDLLIAADGDRTVYGEARSDHGVVYLISSGELAALDRANAGTPGEEDGTIDLGDVAASAGGYVFMGAADGDAIGRSMATLGDIDGDAKADFLIGGDGIAYLVFGGQLDALDAADGQGDGIIDFGVVGSLAAGTAEGVYAFGGIAGPFSVASAGDPDNDGQQDILIRTEDLHDSFLIDVDDLAALDEDGDGVIDLAPICFLRGTRIMTDRGEVAVEDLAPGDLVLTMDQGYRPLVWIGRTRREAVGRMAPVRIARGALGNHRDLWVSPQHRMLLRGWRARLHDGSDAAFAAAIHLVNDGSIRQVEGGRVEYFHIMCDRHQVIFAEGAATESFYPGPQAWKSLPEAAREELLDLFPELAPEAALRRPGAGGHGAVPGYGGLARPVLRRGQAARALRRLQA